MHLKPFVSVCVSMCECDLWFDWLSIKGAKSIEAPEEAGKECEEETGLSVRLRSSHQCGCRQFTLQRVNDMHEHRSLTPKKPFKVPPSHSVEVNINWYYSNENGVRDKLEPTFYCLLNCWCSSSALNSSVFWQLRLLPFQRLLTFKEWHLLLGGEWKGRAFALWLTLLRLFPSLLPLRLTTANTEINTG